MPRRRCCCRRQQIASSSEGMHNQIQRERGDTAGRTIDDRRMPSQGRRPGDHKVARTAFGTRATGTKIRSQGAASSKRYAIADVFTTFEVVTRSCSCTFLVSRASTIRLTTTTTLVMALKKGALPKGPTLPDSTEGGRSHRGEMCQCQLQRRVCRRPDTAPPRSFFPSSSGRANPPKGSRRTRRGSLIRRNGEPAKEQNVPAPHFFVCVWRDLVAA